MKLAGQNPDGSLERAAMPLALIQTAGELAQEFGVLPQYNLVAAIHWAWKRYLDSADAVSLNPSQNCIDALENYLASNWDVTIINLNESERNYREAVGWYDYDCIYILADKIVDITGVGLKRAEIARIPDNDGYLGCKDNDRKTFRRVPGMGGVTVYTLLRNKIGPNPDSGQDDKSLNLPVSLP